jgi:hypothetical protein
MRLWTGDNLDVDVFVITHNAAAEPALYGLAMFEFVAGDNSRGNSDPGRRRGRGDPPRVCDDRR